MKEGRSICFFQVIARYRRSDLLERLWRQAVILAIQFVDIQALARDETSLGLRDNPSCITTVLPSNDKPRGLVRDASHITCYQHASYYYAPAWRLYSPFRVYHLPCRCSCALGE